MNEIGWMAIGASLGLALAMILDAIIDRKTEQAQTPPSTSKKEIIK